MKVEPYIEKEKKIQQEPTKQKIGSNQGDLNFFSDQRGLSQESIRALEHLRKSNEENSHGDWLGRHLMLVSSDL